MAKSNKTDTNKKAVIKALEKSLGIVTTACDKVKISRSQFYKWLEDDSSFKEEVDSVAEMALDFAETELHKQIKGGVPSSTIFYLKSKGKKRGYIEKQEIEHSGNMVIIGSEDRDARIDELNAKLNG